MYYQVIETKTNFDVTESEGGKYYLTMSAILYNGNTKKEVYIPYDLMAQHILSKDPQLTMYCRHNQLEGVQIIDFLKSLGAYNWETLLEDYIYEHYKVYDAIVDAEDLGDMGSEGEGGITV
jgi:hypothetical protein